MASFTKFILLAAVAISASAAPTSPPTAYTTEADVDGQQNGAQCGNGQKLSCCNSGGGLLGLNCLSVPILGVPIQKSCGSNVAVCCQTGDSTGNLINIELNCLTIG